MQMSRLADVLPLKFCKVLQLDNCKPICLSHTSFLLKYNKKYDDM